MNQVRLINRNSPSGGKVWYGDADSDSLVISYGKHTDKRLKKTVVPKAKCTDHNPWVELRKRADKKRREGYEDVTASDDSLPPSTVSAAASLSAAARSAVPSFYWDMNPAGEVASSKERVRAVLSETLTVLQRNGLVESYDDPETNDRVGVETSAGTWFFGYADDVAGSGMIDNKTGKGSGEVRLSDGPVPYLVVFTLAKRLQGEFTAADDDGANLVEGYLDGRNDIDLNQEGVRKAAEALGLLDPIKAFFQEGTSAEADEYDWF